MKNARIKKFPNEVILLILFFNIIQANNSGKARKPDGVRDAFKSNGFW